MRTSGGKIRILDEAERVQSVPHSHIRSLSGLYSLQPHPLSLGAPSRYFARKYSSFLMKNWLFSHITLSESHRNSVLCLERGPEEQLQCVSRPLCFQRRPQQQLQCAGTLLHKGVQQQLPCVSTLLSKRPQ